MIRSTNQVLNCIRERELNVVNEFTHYAQYYNLVTYYRRLILCIIFLVICLSIVKSIYLTTVLNHYYLGVRNPYSRGGANP